MKKVFIIRKEFTYAPFELARKFISDLVGRDKIVKLTVQELKNTRSLVQNAKFHAMCGDIAKQKEFAGMKLTLKEWKLLFISAHSKVTGEDAMIVPGLEGEFVNLRESTAGMSVGRMQSLIEYVEAWGAENDVKFKSRSYENMMQMYME